MTNDKPIISKLYNSNAHGFKKDHGSKKDSLKLSEQEVLSMPRARVSDSLGLQAQILSKTKNLEQTQIQNSPVIASPQGSRFLSWLRPAYLGSALVAVSLLFSASLWLPLVQNLGAEPVDPIASGMSFADLEFHDSLLLQDELLFGAL
jgi:hypothetical protein